MNDHRMADCIKYQGFKSTSLACDGENGGPAMNTAPPAGCVYRLILISNPAAGLGLFTVNKVYIFFFQ